MPGTATVSPTGDPYIDSVIYGTKWAVTNLTFSFPTDPSFYGSSYGFGEPLNNFGAFNATQQAAVQATLGMYSAVANLTFTQVSETSTQHADLRYAMSDAPGTAWAYYPTTAAEGGDAWFNKSTGWYSNPVVGNYGWSGIMHETGHALGLKHPHDVIGSFGAMPLDHDSLEYSVMSYRSYVGASTTTGYTNAADSYPQTLMMYDIAGVQALYGANYATNSGATIYSWDPTTGQEFVNGVAQAMPAGDKIFMTIWDGGGNDTYDFSNYTTAVSVDLRPGDWTTASTTQLANLGNGHVAAGNIANALEYNGNPASLIENAIGGSGNDTLIGNAANNTLTGGAGNDSVDGQGGVNTAVYTGANTDYSVVNNGDGTWTVTDLRGGSPDGTDTLANIQYLQFSNGTVPIGATIVNHPPVAVNDAYTTAAGTALVVTKASGVLANDTDADGNTLTAVLVGAPTHGTFSLASDGSFNFTPDAGWSGTTSFTYKANDGSADSAVATATITVAPPVNHPPVAVNDAYSTAAGTALVVAKASGVLANDTDADGNTLTAVLVGAPTHGSFSLASDGSFNFTPDAGWSGTTSFTYKANDGSADSAVATATITVAPPVNHPPVAVNDSYSTAAGTALVVAKASGVLANDTDADGNTLTAVLVGAPTHGTFSLASDGSFNFTPDAGWSGTTSFTYKANDGSADSAVATAIITVAPPVGVNIAPVAGNDEYTAGINRTLTVSAAAGLLANDSDANGDHMTVTLVKGPSNGTVKVNPDGSFTYTPSFFFSGTTSFQYQVSDGHTTSVVATATIDVRSGTGPTIDQAIVVQNDAYAAVKQTALTVDAQHGVLANDFDKDGLHMTATLVQGSSNGTVNLNPDGSFTFTPAGTFTGPTSFIYKVSDAHGVSTTATATITVAPAPLVNHPPVAVDDAYATAAGTALVVAKAAGVLANDTDADGNTLTAVLVGAPTHGSFSLASDGSFNFTPDAGWSGTTSFTYKANDGSADSAVATATITVAPPVNHPPVAVNDSYSTAAGTALVVAKASGVLANDTDADGNTLTAVLVGAPTHGTFSLASDGSFNFTPDAGWSGTTSFTYKANDGSADSAVATAIITVAPPVGVNIAPVAGNDEYTAGINRTLTVSAAAGLLANDSDANGDHMTVTLVKGPSNGTVKVNPDGSFTYTPSFFFSGTTSFQYQVSDGHTTSVVATATIDVRSGTGPTIDQAIVVQNDAYAAVKQTALTVDAQHGVIANDFDKDGLHMTATLVQGSSNGTVNLNPDGSFTFTPAGTFTGPTSFIYKVSDAHGVSTTATATITVANTGAAPGVSLDGHPAGSAGGLSGFVLADAGSASPLHFDQLFAGAPQTSLASLDAIHAMLMDIIHHDAPATAVEPPDNMPAPAPELLDHPVQHFSEFALV